LHAVLQAAQRCRRHRHNSHQSRLCVRKKSRISMQDLVCACTLPALAPAALDRGDGSVVGVELVAGRGSIAAWRDSRPRSATCTVHCSLGCGCGCGDVGSNGVKRRDFAVDTPEGERQACPVSHMISCFTAPMASTPRDRYSLLDLCAPIRSEQCHLAHDQRQRVVCPPAVNLWTEGGAENESLFCKKVARGTAVCGWVYSRCTCTTHQNQINLYEVRSHD
jgi:hypothetical protein